MKYTVDQYNSIFSKLPQGIRDVLALYSTNQRIFSIGERHRLHIDHQGVLNDLTMDVMMGIVPSGKFIEELAKETGIPRLEASAIVHDIDEEIFKPIKELMVKTYAGEAPFRPKSSLKAVHEDEDPDGIHRDELLRSIEEPDVAQVKKWRSDGTIESIVTFSDAKEFSKTPDPEVFKKTEPATPLNLSQTLKESRERLLNLISSKKLDGVVTMNPHEKKEEELQTPQTFIPEVKKEPAIQVVEKPVEVQKMPENPFTVSAPKKEKVLKPDDSQIQTQEFIVPPIDSAPTLVSQVVPEIKIIDPIKQPLVPEIAPEILPINVVTQPPPQKTDIVAQPAKETPVVPKVPVINTQTTFHVVDPYREL